MSHSPEAISLISNRKTLGIPGNAGSMDHSQTSTKKRVLFFDQIKALMIALVIAVHVPMAFSVSWMGVRIPMEGVYDPLFNTAYRFFGYICQTFFMYMLFLISGYFVPPSVHKKGVVRYLQDRLLRIGVPFLVGLLLINNSSLLLRRLSPASPLAGLSWNAMPFNRVAVLWFLVLLFVFDLLYCSWVALRGDRFSVDTSVPVPQLRSWLISAFLLAILEVAMSTRTELWGALLNSPLDGLGVQGRHLFTYSFMFFWAVRHHLIIGLSGSIAIWL